MSLRTRAPPTATHPNVTQYFTPRDESQWHAPSIGVAPTSCRRAQKRRARVELAFMTEMSCVSGDAIG